MPASRWHTSTKHQSLQNWSTLGSVYQTFLETEDNSWVNQSVIGIKIGILRGTEGG